MKLPLLISPQTKSHFPSQFTREVIWRRHQDKKNKKESKWNDENDRRKRIVHVKDIYGQYENLGFCLLKVYLWVHISLPENEIYSYKLWIHENLKKHSWNQISETLWTFEDLFFEINQELNFINICLKSNCKENNEIKAWEVFDIGLRKRRKRQSPKNLEIKDLLKFAPFNLELGSGPSTEIGIPTLSEFHKIYSIVNNNKDFVFTINEDDLVKRMVSDTKNLYLNITNFFKKCLEVDLNNSEFYKTLKKLQNNNVIAKPVFSHNFDGLLNKINIEEYPLYGFDNIYPKLDFTAKSLLVIGSHADRRFVREQARKLNMPIIFVDPELQDGQEYLIEDAQDNDFIIKMKASEFANALNRII